MNKRLRSLVATGLLLAMLLSAASALAADSTVPTNLMMFNTDSGLTLCWNSVPGAVGYDIYLWDGTNNRMIESVPDDGEATTCRTLMNTGGMVPGLKYTLTVLASNGTSAASFGEFIYEIIPESHPGEEEPFMPGYKPRLPAVLNQRMATRLGPGTRYSEELGTFPKTTEIVVIEQATGSGVPWGLVDFWSRGKHYRAYTGMKRINTSAQVPWGQEGGFHTATLVLTTDVYYGPGYDYATHKQALFAGTQVRCFDEENGFYICDFMRGELWIRGYVPAHALGC